MSLHKVQEWYDDLPKNERDLPLIIVDETAYSPNDVLEQVKAGTQLGKTLQKRVEDRDFGTPEDLKTALAQERLKKILEEKPVDVVRLTVPEDEPSKESAQITEEVSEATGFGEELLEQEKEYVERLRQK